MPGILSWIKENIWFTDITFVSRTGDNLSMTRQIRRSSPSLKNAKIFMKTVF
jgi:hypothetical protein